MHDLERQVELLCPTCGCTQFSYEELSDEQEYADDAEFTCVHCGQVYTKARLIEENAENINAHIAEVEEQLVNEFNKELNEALKKMR